MENLKKNKYLETLRNSLVLFLIVTQACKIEKNASFKSNSLDQIFIYEKDIQNLEFKFQHLDIFNLQQLEEENHNTDAYEKGF